MDPEAQYDSLPAALRFMLEQFAKTLNTCAPGHIRAYDAATRRATVQPALDLLKTDGSAMSAPLIPNVPVVWPSAGGWTFLAPLADGDPVLLVWSQRGLTGFKRAHGRALPDADHLFSLGDAIAIPGFGPATITPASTTGAVLQSTDAATFIALEPTGIRIRTPGRISLTDSQGTKNL